MLSESNTSERGGISKCRVEVVRGVRDGLKDLPWARIDPKIS